MASQDLVSLFYSSGGRVGLSHVFNHIVTIEGYHSDSEEGRTVQYDVMQKRASD